jgi:hypothetical protein
MLLFSVRWSLAVRPSFEELSENGALTMEGAQLETTFPECSEIAKSTYPGKCNPKQSAFACYSTEKVYRLEPPGIDVDVHWACSIGLTQGNINKESCSLRPWNFRGMKDGMQLNFTVPAGIYAGACQFSILPGPQGESTEVATTPEKPSAVATTAGQLTEVATTPQTPPVAATTPEQPTKAATTPEPPPAATATPEQSTEAVTTPEPPTAAATTAEQPKAAATTPKTPPAAATTPEQPTKAATTPEQPTAVATDAEQPTKAATTPEQPMKADTTPEKPSVVATTPEQSAKEQLMKADTTPETPSVVATTPEQSAEAATTPKQSMEAATTPVQPTMNPATTKNGAVGNSAGSLFATILILAVYYLH